MSGLSGGKYGKAFVVTVQPKEERPASLYWELKGHSVHFNSRTAVEVLSILRDQYRAERDYANSRYDYILNMLRLKEAVGDLSKDDVKQINYWLKH